MDTILCLFLSQHGEGACSKPEGRPCSDKSPFSGTEGMALQLGDLSSVCRTSIKKPVMVVHVGDLSTVWQGQEHPWAHWPVTLA